MTRKVVFVALLVAVLALLGATAVSADTGAGQAKTAGTVVIRGTGTLSAQGAGVAWLNGSGNIFIRGHGLATIYVRNADRIVASGAGRRLNLRNGITLFVGWRGTVDVAGDHMSVRIQGGLIDFTATGTGRAVLRGRGHYQLGDQAGDWNPASTSVEYSEAQ